MLEPVDFALCKGIETLGEVKEPIHYVMEPKLDGFRLQAVISGGKVRLYTRTFHSAAGKLPAVETSMRELLEGLDGTVLDGEAVYIDEQGKADFNFTARVMGSHVGPAVTKQRDKGYVSFLAFDVMFVKGQDVRHLALQKRRRLLEQVVRLFDSEHIILTPQAPPSEAQHRFYTEMYGEGSVVKDLRAPYKAGRNRNMLKWKKVQDEDVVIMGFAPGKGKYEGQVGAVVYGQVKDGQLKRRGQCSGMTDAVRLSVSRNQSVFQNKVLVITHNGVLAGAGFRHPQWSHIRHDKLPEECEWT